MGFVTFSMPQEIVLSFIQGGKIVNFIETGTFRGGTTFWAAQHFENVYTIEINEEYFKSLINISAVSPLISKRIVIHSLSITGAEPS